MKEADLLRFIGRPSERSGMRGGGEILSWRYYNTGCLWWQAQLDAQRVDHDCGLCQPARMRYEVIERAILHQLLKGVVHENHDDRRVAGGLLAACAGYAPPNDMRAACTEAEVVQAMGPPTGRYQLPEGPTRLEFARGPYGRHTYMVDLDAQGRVLKWDQVLDRRYFEAVTPGMTSEQLLRFIGRPSERDGHDAQRPDLVLPLLQHRMPVVAGATRRARAWSPRRGMASCPRVRRPGGRAVTAAIAGEVTSVPVKAR